MCEHCGCRRYAEIADLGAQHDRIEETAGEILQLLGRGERAGAFTLVETLRSQIEPHSRQEETGIFRDAWHQGIARNYWVDELEDDHRRFAEVLARAPQMSSDELGEFLDDLHRHISVEEYDLFPAMARAWDASETVDSSVGR